MNYVYIYLDPRRPGKYSYEKLNMSFLYAPLYVGKGSGDRIFAHLRSSLLNDGTPFHNVLRNMLSEGISPIYFKINDYLDEETSYDLENSFIQGIGKIVEGSGCLLNVNDGIPVTPYTREDVLNFNHPRQLYSYLVVDDLGDVSFVPRGHLNIFCEPLEVKRKPLVLSSTNFKETNRVHKITRGKLKGWFCIDVSEYDNIVSKLDNQQLFTRLEKYLKTFGEDLEFIIKSERYRPKQDDFLKTWNSSFSRDYMRGENNTMHKQESKRKMSESRKRNKKCK